MTVTIWCDVCEEDIEWDGRCAVICPKCKAVNYVEVDVCAPDGSPIEDWGVAVDALPRRISYGADHMGLSPFEDVTGKPMWDCHGVYRAWRNWIEFNYIPSERLVDSISRFWREHSHDYRRCG